MNELVITNYNGKRISAIYNEGRMTNVSVIPPKTDFEIGNIYVGRVDNIVKNINAAFVNISDTCSCYLDLNSDEKPLFVKRQSEKKVCIGDEIIVQLVKESIKTKAPVVTTSFSLAGRFVSLVKNGSGAQVSKKISNKQTRQHLKDLLAAFSAEDYCIIARTNSVHASDEQITREATQLVEKYRNICEHSVHASKYSVIHKELPAYLIQLRDTNSFLYDRIVTDIPEVYDEIDEYLKHFPTVNDLGEETQVLFTDDPNRLNILYKIDKNMDGALRRILNLKSGASIIIDQTEALTAIDVNTSKAISGKRATEQTFFEINCEAAREIAYQLKLRNISGIIVIDFINQHDEGLRTKLLENLKNEFRNDSIQTELVDITKLGLVEVTRKKVHKCIAEQLKI
ncbi:MAG: ribonuclease E/G [Lachnospiraceae bacterium]|nr:ribonuclease E/G [Lachnospiraceae bacterium]